MMVHGSCAARSGEAVLFLGAPGAGKSDLVLRLIDRGWILVADDQVELSAEGGQLLADSPIALRGLLEVRGLGILAGQPVQGRAPLRLVVDCLPRADIPRLPHPARFESQGIAVPRLALHAHDASAGVKVECALALATGRRLSQAGAFAA
ncbi:HPr kinase/phosphatase C-terminal domain-containing protein [Acetobacteraceae bacterium H6797]|nr:HPr kinase/phosphatase C-terminal domain-containing protein [Acetobacteraceae bacterium H6797]